jgi:hypothetical protein
MSSKSKKSSKRSSHGHGGQRSSGHQAEPTAPQDHDEDELVHVPEGRSRLKFVLMIGLLIFLLATFMIPTAMMGALGGDSGPVDDLYFSWERPGQGKQQVSYGGFFQEKRRFAAALSLDVYQKIMLGVFDREPSDEDTARLIILDALAQDAGISISDDDLKEYLRQEVIAKAFGGDTQSYVGFAQRYEGAPVLEHTVRRCMRARRYVQLMTHLATAPTAEGLEDAWSQDHVEASFQIARVELDTLEEYAREQLPDDAELETYWNELPETDRQTYMVGERRRAELGRFRLPEPGATADHVAALLAAYPDQETPEEGVTPEEWAESRARDYYNKVYPIRFIQPAEPVEDDDNSLPKPATYFPFDEVKDACLLEGPVYFAVDDWLLDLQKRATTGEEIDLSVECEELGLEYFEQPDAYTQIEYSEGNDLGGVYLASAVRRTEVGDFSSTLVLSEEWFGVTRVLEILEPAMPPFADVRDRVADTWAFDWLKDDLVARLEEIRDGFEEIPEEADEAEETEEPVDEAAEDDAPVRRRTDAETFRTACEAAGLEVLDHDWLDKSADATSDPDFDDPVHVFLRGHREYYDFDEGEVSEPAFDLREDWIHLVRMVGTRPVSIDGMTANQYSTYKLRSSQTASGALRASLSSNDLLERFAVEFLRPSDDDEPADES